MNSLRVLGGIVLFVFLFSSCDNENSFQKFEMPKGGLILNYNTPQRVSESMTLKIVRIEDNRCPIGSCCSSTGDVTVFFESYLNNNISEVSIVYKKNQPELLTTVNEHQISIVDVFPYRYHDDVGIDIKDFRIYLKVVSI